MINISSISGSTVDNTGAPYAMNKAALEQLTRYLACEWGPLGIRVNAVAPWFVRTPLTSPLLADPRFFDAVRRVTPMARVGEPHEVACVVAFLAMPAAGYISGQVRVDSYRVGESRSCQIRHSYRCRGGQTRETICHLCCPHPAHFRAMTAHPTQAGGRRRWRNDARGLPVHGLMVTGMVSADES